MTRGRGRGCPRRQRGRGGVGKPTALRKPSGVPHNDPQHWDEWGLESAGVTLSAELDALAQLLALRQRLSGDRRTRRLRESRALRRTIALLIRRAEAIDWLYVAELIDLLEERICDHTGGSLVRESMLCELECARVAVLAAHRHC
jgi:hypothetical protein